MTPKLRVAQVLIVVEVVRKFVIFEEFAVEISSVVESKQATGRVS